MKENVWNIVVSIVLIALVVLIAIAGSKKAESIIKEEVIKNQDVLLKCGRQLDFNPNAFDANLVATTTVGALTNMVAQRSILIYRKGELVKKHAAVFGNVVAIADLDFYFLRFAEMEEAAKAAQEVRKEIDEWVTDTENYNKICKICEY